MGDTKFKFTTEFQFDLLKFTLKDRDGYKALELYDDSYFTLTEHAVIAYTLKRYYKIKKRIPGRVIFKEEILKTFDQRDFVNNLTDDDRKEVLRLINKAYKEPVQDGTDILENAERFAQFVEVKDVIEGVDLLDYEAYEPFSRKVQKAISPKLKALDEKGAFLIKDIKFRQFRRQDESPIVPTPYRQINQLTNAGGYTRGSIMVILDRAKKFKTGMLVNIAKGYMRHKNILVIDLDNGADEWMMRVEQSVAGITKQDLLSGDYDLDIQKSLRKRKTLKAELIIKRMPSLITTSNDIASYMDYLYMEFGIRIDILVIDYISKMGSISGKESMHERISESYIDIGNLAMKYNIAHVWTAQHVTREAAKHREKSKYEATDVAGSIDITRHVQAIFGLNRNKDEEAAGIQRMEIVDQRDGIPNGRAILMVDYEKQQAKEPTRAQLKVYYDEYRSYLDGLDEGVDEGNGNGKKTKNDLEDAE